MNHYAPFNSTSQIREDGAVEHSSVAAGDLETGYKRRQLKICKMQLWKYAQKISRRNYNAPVK